MPRVWARLSLSYARHPLRHAVFWSVVVFVAVAGQFLFVSPILESPDGYEHYMFIRSLAREGRFPRLDQSLTEEAGQFPLYYLIAAALVRPLSDSDLAEVAIVNPHGVRQSDDNPNFFYHRPFQGFPTGTELAVRVVEVFSTLCGTLTVICAVLLARILRPESPNMWLATGVAIAANPAFAYLSASVTNDNLVVAMCSVAIVALARWASWKPSSGSMSAAAAIGTAVLAKFNAIGLTICYVMVLVRQERCARERLLGIAKLAVAMAVLDGWWLFFNARLYGDPTTVLARNEYVLGSTNLPRVLLDRLPRIPAGLPELIRSFFALFGRYVLTSNRAFVLTGSLCAIGLAAGFGVLAKRREPLLSLLGGWIAITSIGALAYATISYNDGRFLFPAIGCVAVICVLGWEWILVRLHLKWAGPVLLLVGITASSLCAWLVVAPAYTQPRPLSQLPAGVRPLSATFGDAVQLIGVDAPTDAYVSSGTPYEVSLYWRLLKPVDRPLSSFVHIESNDAAYQPMAGYEGASARGLYPPNFWRVGDIVPDHHTFALAPDRRPAPKNAVMLNVRVGLYYLAPVAGAQPERLSSDPPEASETGITVATWKLPGTRVSATPPIARFGPRLELLSAQPSLSGSDLKLNLLWQAAERIIENYSVSVQLRSADQRLLAQHDSYPLNGTYPTGEWFENEQVADIVTLPLPRQAQPGDFVTVSVYVLPDQSPIATDTGEPFVRLELSSDSPRPG